MDGYIKNLPWRKNTLLKGLIFIDDFFVIIYKVRLHCSFNFHETLLTYMQLLKVVSEQCMPLAYISAFYKLHYTSSTT